MSIQSSYAVAGMTCAHCVSAVTTEVGRLPGVEAVRVDLAAGQIHVASAAPLALPDVAAAVDEAGYRLVDSPA